MEIGYPPLPVSLLVDTGSADLWVNGACQNCSFKAYNASASESSVLIHKDLLFWEEYYPPGATKVTGFYASDFYNIANTVVQNVSFGVANYTGPSYRENPGILGLGPDGHQTISEQTLQRFDSILDRMKLQGVTESASFGLFLGGQSFNDDAPGEITFGGFNPSKISGSLVPLPMVASPDQFSFLNVMLSGISVALKGKRHTLRQDRRQLLGNSVTLDSGFFVTSLPPTMYYDVIGLLHVNPNTRELDCKYYEPGYGMDFTFLGFGGTSAKIWVPFRYFIYKNSTEDLCWLSISEGVDCSWGITQMNCPTLGADFLRAAYIYVNYDNSTLSIGQAAYERHFSESPMLDSTGEYIISNPALLRQTRGSFYKDM